jgi:hypothetical protein
MTCSSQESDYTTDSTTDWGTQVAGLLLMTLQRRCGGLHICPEVRTAADLLHTNWASWHVKNNILVLQITHKTVRDSCDCSATYYVALSWVAGLI